MLFVKTVHEEDVKGATKICTIIASKNGTVMNISYTITEEYFARSGFWYFIASLDSSTVDMTRKLLSQRLNIVL